MKSRNLLFNGAVALLAFVLPFGAARAFAQDHDRGQGRDHDRDHDRDRDHPRFEDHDRQAVRGWFKEHHGHLPPGLRDRDRLAPDLESRLQVGLVLDPGLRHRIYPVPEGLLVQLPPCPRHYRYVVIGDHICLIDDGYHVFDVIHFELNF